MFVRVCVPVSVTIPAAISLVKAIVPVLVGSVRVAAPLVIDEITGVVSVLFVRVSVEDVVTIFIPSMATTPADTRESVVSVACPNSTLPNPKAVDVDAVIPLNGNPVALVSVNDVGVPRSGVVNVGLLRFYL